MIVGRLHHLRFGLVVGSKFESLADRDGIPSRRRTAGCPLPDPRIIDRSAAGPAHLDRARNENNSGSEFDLLAHIVRL